jgi:mxaC protein
LKTKYQAYEAEDPETLQSAIQDINLRERKPIRYLEKIHGQNYSSIFILTAMLLIVLLLFIKRLGISVWKQTSPGL